MDFKRIDEDTVEIIPGELSPQEVLAEMARLSYETASSPLPLFIQPFEITASLLDFKGLVKNKGLHVDYLNGRVCSTHVERRDDRLFLMQSVSGRIGVRRSSSSIFSKKGSRPVNDDLGENLWF